MQIVDGGKQHVPGDSRCPACAEIAGVSLDSTQTRYPYPDNQGVPPCGGFIHAEIIEGRDQFDVKRLCDKCSEPR